MKRPQRFDRQIAAGQQPAAEREERRARERAARVAEVVASASPAPAPAPTRDSSDGSDIGSDTPHSEKQDRSSWGSENPTEPIDGVVRGSSGSPAPGLLERLSPAALLERIRPGRADAVAASSAESRADPRGAKRDAAKAGRDRRRYERAEVRRFTRRSRRRRLTLGLSLGSVLVLAVGVVAVAYSPLLSVRTIAVSGTYRVAATDVVAALQGQVGTPLALVSGSSVADELAGFPLIRSYSIEATPPDTLTVRIVEREPIAVIESGGGFALVDAAGVTISTAAEPPEGYPVLEVSGGQASGDAFEAAVTVLLALPASLDARIATVAASTVDDVTLTLAEGDTSVLWGSAEQSELKAVVLEKLMAGTDPSGVDQYDVSSPTTAVVR